MILPLHVPGSTNAIPRAATMGERREITYIAVTTGPGSAREATPSAKTRTLKAKGTLSATRINFDAIYLPTIP